MSKEKALLAAKYIARKHQTRMAVVNAPIENAEDDGPWGYCPEQAVKVLFPHGTVETVVNPN